MKLKLLKDIAVSQRKLRKELSFLKNNPEQRKPQYYDVPKSSVIALSVEGNTLKVIGFK